MLNRKSQAAMEFLMTYGWAILVILIVMTSLFFFGVFDSKNKTSCNVEAPFVCRDVKINEGGVMFLLGNRNVDSISGVNVKINGNDCDEIYINDVLASSAVNIDNQLIRIECRGEVLNSNDKVNVDLNFVYTSVVGSLDHDVTASARGIVETGGGEEPPEEPPAEPPQTHKFGWAGNDSNDYYSGISGTVYGGLIPGDSQSGFFDNNATQFGNSKYIDFGAQNFDIKDELTLSAWFKSNGAPPYSVYHALFMQGSLNFGILVRDSSRMYSYLTNTEGTRVAVVAIDTLLDGNWHHLAMTYNGANVRAYIDGDFINSLPQTGDVRFTGSAFIGRYGSYYSNSFMDEFHIWNETLTDMEITDLYNSYI